MQKQKESWKALIAETLNGLAEGIKLEGKDIAAGSPPSPEMGDLGFPMFAYAKALRKSPKEVADLVAEALSGKDTAALGGFRAEGPYLNVTLNRPEVAGDLLSAIFDGGDGGFPFARPGTMAGK
ncbi:MAG: arginine--tRNA ligase, partial [Treponema sp.]|nr:arginine--tRNA ligase [Treponema sp.]